MWTTEFIARVWKMSRRKQANPIRVVESEEGSSAGCNLPVMDLANGKCLFFLKLRVINLAIVPMCFEY